MPDIGPLSPINTVKVSTSQLHSTSATANTDSEYVASQVSTAVLTTLNDLVNAMSAVDFFTKFAATMENFGGDLLATLACYSTGLNVAGQTLAVAASSFQGLDDALAKSFTALESQISTYTGYDTAYTLPTLSASSIALGTTGLSMQTVGYQYTYMPASTGGGIPFAHIWHDLKNWGTDAFHAVDHGLEYIGVPPWAALPIAGGVYVGYWAVTSIIALLTGAAATA